MNKRMALVAPFGCLVLVSLGLALSWIGFRIHRTDASQGTHPTRSWSEDLGSHPPGSEPALATALGPPQRSLTLPGVLSVEDAVEVGGIWVLLDPRSGRLHFLDSSSGSVHSVGGRGPGPGELQDPVALAYADSTIWVLNRRGLLLDGFNQSGDFRERRRLTGGGCLAGLSKGLIALNSRDPVVSRVCPAPLPGPGTLWIELVDVSGSLSPVLAMPLGTRGSRRLHLYRQPAVAAGDGRIFLGTWDAPCIGEFSIRGEPSAEWCLPDFQRAPPPPGEKAKLESRFRRLTALGLLPIQIPDLLPWYDRIFFTHGGLVVRRIRGEEERDLVFLKEGEPPMVTEAGLPRSTFAGIETVLTAEDHFQGTRIQIFPSPWHRGFQEAVTTVRDD